MYGRKLSARRETDCKIVLRVFIVLTGDDQDISVLVSVVRPVSCSTVSDSEPGGLVTDQLKYQTHRIYYNPVCCCPVKLNRFQK